MLRHTSRTLLCTLPKLTRCLVTRKLSHIGTSQHLPRYIGRVHLLQRVRYFSDYPDHYRIDMPALSPTMEAGTIVAWSVSEGDELGDGDLLAQIETDKATMDFETPEVGYLAKILIPAGTADIKLGRALCIIVENKDDIAKFANYVATEEAPQPAAPQPPTPQPPTPQPATPQPSAPQPSASQPHGSRIMASPMARTLAARKGVDLSQLQGSGQDGVIRAIDIEAAAPGAVAAPGAAVAPPVLAPDGSFTEIALTGMRKAIAKRLTQSKQEVPHYYLTVDISLDELLAVRQELNTDSKKLSVTDFIIKASSKALLDVPEANSQWSDTCIRRYHNADISVAVATESGLITPIIFTANNKSLLQINADMMALKDKAKAGTLQPHEFQGGTFTISNLGMMGIDQFTAVINPPQSCILAVGAPSQKLIPADNEKGFEVRKMMTVSLCCDHRVVDGAVGAQWLAKFKAYLEKPITMLL